MISVIIPVYNQAFKLVKCLNSLLDQSYHRYEIIIVNDGSIDDFEDVMEQALPQMKHKHVQIINQPNQGANVARNTGATAAAGDFLLFCDADVVMQRHMLERLRNALLDHTYAAYAYSSFKFGPKTFKLFDFDDEKLRRGPFIHTTSLIRREAFPGFDPAIKRFQDWDLWLTMLENNQRGVWVEQVLFKVAGGGTMSAWLPSAAYKLLPGLGQVKQYNQAMAIIKTKHNLV